jgi:hypothetical protein
MIPKRQSVTLEEEMKRPSTLFLVVAAAVALSCGSQQEMSTPTQTTSATTPQTAAQADTPAPGSCTFSGAWGATATIQHFEFDPLVVNTRIADAVALKVKLPAGIDGVSLELNGGGTLELTPSGSGGLFCGMLTSAQVLAGYQVGDQHNFVGYLDLSSGGTTRARLNMFVNVIDDQTPFPAVERLRDNLQATSHVANLYISDQLPQNLDARAVLQQLYGAYGDVFDFVNLVSTPDFTANRFHVTVSNDVRGTGAAIVNDSASYGSAGRLLGYNRFPITTFYDLAAKGAIHEIGHQWINFSRASALRPGSPHWPTSTMARGIMGFSISGPGGEGGDFPWALTSVGGDNYRLDLTAAADAYNDMELYLMGLLGPESVPPQVVLDDQSARPCGGCVAPGHAFTVQELIAADGPRSPAFPNAPNRYNVGTIVVSMERLLTRREMAFFDAMTARGESATSLPYSSGFARGTAKPFAVATGNRASLTASLGPHR